jgi:hypothetical protein
MLAAQWGGYKMEEFEALEGERQAFIVAAYRSDQQIKAVLDNEQVKAMRKPTPRRARTR